MKEINIPHFAEQSLVTKSLVVSAKHSSESMETFVHWMLGGFGAGLIYLLGQTGTGATQVTASTLKEVGLLYLYAVVLGATQRIFAMLVKTGTNAFQEAEKLPDNKTPVDLAQFFIIYIKVLPASTRWVVALVARRFLRGNLTDTGRYLLWLAVTQSLFGAGTGVVLLYGLYLVITKS